MPGRDTYRGAKRAREARERWGVAPDAPLPCVVAAAEAGERLPVVVAPLPETIAGALDRRGVIWVNGANATSRQRFTVAHEIGHRCCGHEAPPVDSPADLTNGHDPMEVQANAFAAELLAPKAGVVAMVDGPPTLEHVVRVAARFGLSPLAASYRFATLGLATSERCAQLAAEIDEGLHLPLWDALGLAPPSDLLAALGPDDLPRLPVALRDTVLHRLITGDWTIEHAALELGVPSQALAGGLETIDPEA